MTTIQTLDLVALISTHYDLRYGSSKTLVSTEHSSLVIWPDTNSFTWFSRGISGGPDVWLHRVVGLEDEEIEEYLNDPAFYKELKYDLLPDIVPNIPLGRVGYNEYIEKRGVKEETANFFKIEIIGNDIIIPMYNNQGNRIGSLLRRHDTNVPHLKYRKIISDHMCGLWNNRFVERRFEDNVIIFEGAWSVMRWWQVAKENNLTIIPMAILSTAVINALPLLHNLKNVTFVLDHDEKSKAGQLLYERISVHEGINNWQYFEPPIYPDEMNDNQILYMLNEIGVNK